MKIEELAHNRGWVGPIREEGFAMARLIIVILAVGLVAACGGDGDRREPADGGPATGKRDSSVVRTGAMIRRPTGA